MRAHLTFILYTLAGLIAACHTAPTASPIPSVDQMEQTWREQNIASYRIEVLVVRSVWHAQSHQITIRNNQVESATASCIPAPTEGGTCQIEAFNAEDYTVPGLFVEAQVQTQSQQAAWTKITYDQTYGFPKQISYDNPEVIDEDWTWRVTAFEVLK
jgi:uncharacterized protein DUF6174